LTPRTRFGYTLCMPSTETPTWASVTNVKLDAEDTALLDRCVEAEKLPKSEILRRALRAFAKQTLEPASAPAAATATPQSSVA